MKLFNKTTILFVTFIVIVILITAGYVFESLKYDYQKLLLDEASSTVGQKVNLLDVYVDDMLLQTKLIDNIPKELFSDFDMVDRLDENIQQRIEQQFSDVIETNPDILSIRILDLDGAEIIGYETIDGMVVKTSPEDQYSSGVFPFTDSDVLNSVHVSTIQLREKNGMIQYPLTKIVKTTTPITNYDDKPVSFLELTYNIEPVLTKISSSSFVETTIIDQNGSFLLSSDPSKEFGSQWNNGQNYFVEEPELKNNIAIMDSKQHFDVESQEFRIWEKVFYDENDNSRFWVVVSIIPQSALFYHIGHLQSELLLVVFMFIIGTILVTVMLSRHITRPIKSLLKGVQKIENGDLSYAIQKPHDDEIGDLVDSFNHMTRSLVKSKKLVAESENKLEFQIRDLSTLTNALDKTVMVTKTDANGNIIYVNDIFCKLTEYNRDELIGKSHRIIKSNYHSNEFYKNMWNTLLGGKTWVGEIKNKTKTGKELWTFSTIAPGIDDDGQITEFISTKVDITSRKRAENELIKALNHLKSLDKAKSEFSAMVSHELRTPLTPILTYCDILKEEQYSNLSELQKDCLMEIESNAIKLNQLISDILDAQKLEMQKIKFNKQPIIVNSLLDEVIKELGPAAKKKGIRLIKTIEKNETIVSDKLRIYQVLSNLIRNSLDFVAENTGIVLVGTKKDKDRVIFYVKDNGIGISEDKVSSLFKKFYQIDSGVRRTHGGNGLGLVISKGIVEGLGGTIWVSSKLNIGTTFYFSIPLKQESLVKIKNE